MLLLPGADTEAVDVSSAEENGDQPVEHDVNKMSDKRSAKIVLLVAFNANCYDNLSVKKSLVPLAKHLSVKTRGLGKYDMAIPIAKELIKQEYITSKENEKQLNYNGIKRNDITFLYKGSTKEDSVSGAAGTGSGLKRSINAQGKRFVSSSVLTSSYTHSSASVVDDSSSESENDPFE